MTRIQQEKRIVGEMILLHCRLRHGAAARGAAGEAAGGRARGSPPCAACALLLDYASARLDACRYGEAKTSCLRCPTHCYSPSRREAIRAVMRFSGPRMLLRRPLAALRHLLG